MPLPEHRSLAARLQALPGVFAKRFQHMEAGFLSRSDLQQALVHQRREHIKHIGQRLNGCRRSATRARAARGGRRRADGAAHLLCRRDGEAPGEDR